MWLILQNLKLGEKRCRATAGRPSVLTNLAQKFFGLHEFELHGEPIVQKFQ